MRFAIAALLALGSLLGSGASARHSDGATGIGTLSSQSPGAEPEGLERAQSLLRDGDVAGADKAAREFLTHHADSAEGHFLLGYILFRKMQAHGTNPSTLNYAANESETEFREANAKESLAEFTAGARYHDPSAFDLKIVAFDYILLDDSKDADKWLTRATELDPKDSDIWYNLGRTKYTENRFQEAIHAFEECLKLDPKNVKAEDNLGLSYYGLGRTDDALKAYKTAIEWQSQAAEKDAQPFIDLGTLYIEKNQPKEALPYLEQAMQIAPGDAKGHEELGKAHSALNDLPKAQSEFEKAVTLAPNVARLHYMLGQVYRREGMIDKAKEQFARVAELNGTHSSEDKPID
ncbi:MAG TPA: tetratricopeptide repeat protein [Candidatus Limnocylindrales bacterium]|nr:tetratricopeptide repeat protein [Candidatus Limnocylindrales bacterium]